MAVTLTLEDEIDVSRGDMITRSDNLPLTSHKFEAKVVWMTEQPMIPGKQYYLKLATKSVSGFISKLYHRIDVNSLEQFETGELKLNEIGLCDIAVNAPVAFDPYRLSEGTGSFIIIDRLTNVTVGAGMITGSVAEGEIHPVSTEDRCARYGQKAVTVWLTGDRSGQTARELERRLFDMGHTCAILDQKQVKGDMEEISSLFNQAGIICICSVGNAPAGLSANSVAFSCDKEPVDLILQNITVKAQLR